MIDKIFKNEPVPASAAMGSDAIAIIGMAGRFPGAANIDAFWRNLCAGVESIRFFSAEELAREGIAPELIKHPNYIPAKGMLDDIDQFDAGFFGYGPREAESLDPQQRVFLECAWEALERAGYDSARYSGVIGLYASVSLSAYGLALLENAAQGAGVAAISAFDKDFLTSRAAYHLDLRGPCVTMQSACSSSLTAVHYACQSLISGECDMMLAGGVSVSIPQRAGYVYQAGGIGSSDGHCRAFDSRADGTLNGDAVALVVLKRLDDALADRDHIHGLILGSAVTNDGAVRSGFSAPGVDGQLRAIRSAQQVAGVSADSIGYVEAHGTGTALGDPIEVAALTQAFRIGTQRRQFCALGSVKTNIGHTDAAAGAAGLIKATLALEHALIPPSLHFRQANPECQFETSPFYVCHALQPWPPTTGPRRAGVSSFGMGGTNAHVVLQAAPVSAAPGADKDRPELILVSARSEIALRQAAAQLAEHLDKPLSESSGQRLADIAYTCSLGRRSFAQRRFVVGNNASALAAALREPAAVELANEAPALYLYLPACSDAALLCAQASRLYSMQAALAAIMDTVLAELPDELAAVLRAGLRQERALTQSEHVQALAGLLQFALGHALRLWGMAVYGVWGQGSGCYTASALAGLFTASEAVQLAAASAATDRQALQDLCARLPSRSPRLELRLGSVGERCQTLRDPAQCWRWYRETATSANEPEWLSEQTGVAIVVLGDPAGFAAHPRRRCVSALPRSAEDSLASLLNTLGSLWCWGFAPDWQAIYQDQQRARVPLPTYPFQRQRYFLSRPARGEAGLTSAKTPAQQAPEQWLNVPYWRQTQSVSPIDFAAQDTHWLIFRDAGGLGDVLAERLEQAGQSRGCVRPGAEYRQQDRQFTLTPDRAEHYQALARSLPASSTLNIVHLWALDDLADESERFRIAQRRGLFSVLQLVKALAGRTGSTNLTVLGGPTERILGDEAVAPEWATLRGAVLTVPWEFPHWSCRWIELERAPAYPSWLADSVLAECGANGNAPLDRLIAYRGRRRWRRQFETLQAQPQTSRLRQGGVYLITGASGGIGLRLADYLFQTYRARLILLTRSLPPDDTEAGRHIAAWREQGHEFSVFPVELGNHKDGLARALQQACEHYGPINGLFHAAGLAGGGLIARREPEDLWPELETKALALQHLAQLLPFEALDFVLLFSAHTSLMGGLGQVSYAAANAFLDSYAHACSPATPISAINWDRWQGVGMARQAERLYRELSGNALEGGLSAGQGLAQCARLLSLPACPQIVVSSRALETVLLSPPSPDDEPVAAEAGGTEHSRPADLAQAYEPPQGETEHALAGLWQDLLGIAPIGRADDFFDLGGHSLLAVQLIDDIRIRFQTDLALDSVFEAPSLAQLAARIDNTLSVSGQQSTGQEASPEFEEGSL